jgi:sugar lactone lactonase YvrE/fibronectin type 3 domain-containing protein
MPKRLFWVRGILVLALFILAGGAAVRAAIAPPEWVGIYDVRGKAGLLWIKAPGVSRFRIFRRRADENSFSLIGETLENRFVDDKIQPRITYSYRLVAVTSGGGESTPSLENTFTLMPKVKEALPPPRWEGYLLSERGIGLKWEHPDPSSVVAFNIYRAKLPDGAQELIASTRENAFTDYRVEGGQAYRYRVSALDGNFKETPLSGDLDAVYVAIVAEKVEKSVVYNLVPRRTVPVRTIVEGRKDVPLNAPSDVAVTDQGLLYVADSGNGAIQVYGKNGDFRWDFPVAPESLGGRSMPLGLTVDREGSVFCSDAYAGRVVVFNSRGRVVRILLLPRESPQERFGLLDLAVTGDGTLFVVDNLNHRVAQFGSDSQFVRYIGRPGVLPGEFTTPGFCSVDKQDRLLVADALLGRIQVFDVGGEFQKAFGRYARNVGTLARPKGIAVDAKGRIYVADSWTCQIQAFDDSGRYLFTLADENGRPLDLGSPNGIAIDADNNIYIAERLAHRVQIRRIEAD